MPAKAQGNFRDVFSSHIAQSGFYNVDHFQEYKNEKWTLNKSGVYSKGKK